MKRFVLLLLVLLLLPGCGIKKDANSVYWEVIEKDSWEYEEARGLLWPWLDRESDSSIESNEYESWSSRELRLSDTVAVYEKLDSRYDLSEIWIRDSTTGEDALLIKHCSHEPEDEIIGDDVLGSDYYCFPYLIDMIDSRFFVFEWGREGSDVNSPACIYDIQNRQEVLIFYPDGYANYSGIIDGKIYMTWTNSDYNGEANGNFRVLCVDIASLDKGKPIMAEDLLKGVPGNKNLPTTNHWALSPDARYLAANSYKFHTDSFPSILYIFDISQRKLLLQLEQPEGTNLALLDFVGTHTLYWFGDEDIVSIHLF